MGRAVAWKGGERRRRATVRVHIRRYPGSS